MIVVTSGAKYIDIDAYACCVAYAELLSLRGHEAAAISTAPLNESITPSLRALSPPFLTSYTPHVDATFVVVDLSDPAEFDSIVDVSKIVQIFDHHSGFEAHWAQALGTDSHIEFIGAAATLIYEQWQAADKLAEMSHASAMLLAAAILDNTLHFGASITTDRDRAAYAFLAKHAGLDAAWAAHYFLECQQSILTDLPSALRNDAKITRVPQLAETLCLGQLVIWDARQVISDDTQVISQNLQSIQKTWLANIVSVSEGRSYLMADDPRVRDWLGALLGVTFQGSTAVADRLWLRKEILKAALQDKTSNG